MAADHPFRPDTNFLDQHFLDPALARTLIDQVDIGRDDVVLDLGAGTGALTAEILRRRPRRLIAIEIDPRCAPALGGLAARSDLDVRFTRIQDLRPADVCGVTMIIANPPFSTLEHIAALMRRLSSLMAAHLCVSLTWASSVTASPSSDLYSLSSLAVQTRFDAQIVQPIDGSSFAPASSRAAAWLHLQPASSIDPLADMFADYALHRAGTRVKDFLRSRRVHHLPIDPHRVAALQRDVMITGLQQRRLSALTSHQLAHLVLKINSSNS